MIALSFEIRMTVLQDGVVELGVRKTRRILEKTKSNNGKGKRDGI